MGGSERRGQAPIKRPRTKQVYTLSSSPSVSVSLSPTHPHQSLSFYLLLSAIYLLCDLGVDYLVYLSLFPQLYSGKKIV